MLAPRHGPGSGSPINVPVSASAYDYDRRSDHGIDESPCFWQRALGALASMVISFAFAFLVLELGLLFFGGKQ